MRRAYLQGAEQEQIASTVRDVLERLGARVTEHTRSHTAFTDLEDADAGWTKGGYVGTYRHVGEDEVELRYDVHAAFPERLFWTTVSVELVVVVGLFLLRPGPLVWVVSAIGLWTLLVGAFLLYLHTWRSASRLEEDLLDLTVDEVEEQQLGTALTEEERAQEALEEEVEAEVLARELSERREDPGDRGLLARLRDRAARAAAGAGSSDEGADETEAKRERVRELRRRLDEEGGDGDGS